MLLALGVAALLLATRGGDDRALPPLPAAPAVAAGDFQDSVGVNVHLSYGDTAYGDFPAVQRALADLGVRHVRDGACAGCTEANDRIRALAERGVRFTLIAGSPKDTTGTLPDNLASIRSLGPAVEAVEGPNEYDNQGDPQWASALRDYQRELAEGVAADPELKRLPVIGPSFVRPGSRAEAGDLSAWMTHGNLHSYAGGGEPAAGLERERSLAATVSGERPVMATETGYHDAAGATTGQPGVDEETAAAYIPRLYLDYFRTGIRRAFVYELADQKPDPAGTDPERHFGLLRSDWTPKPAYAALKGLLAAIGDGAPRAAGRRCATTCATPPATRGSSCWRAATARCGSCSGARPRPTRPPSGSPSASARRSTVPTCWSAAAPWPSTPLRPPCRSSSAETRS